MSLEALERVLPPPDSPTDQPGGGEWAAAELAVGMELPPDYKSMIDRYGSGSIDGFLVVFNPAARREPMRLVPAITGHLDALRTIRAAMPAEVPYPIHPEPGGLVPWGRTDNGDVGYWLASPADEPARWSVAIGEAGGPGWFTHPGPLTQFLADVLGGSVRVPFLPATWPSGRPRFDTFELTPQHERLLRLVPRPASPPNVPSRADRARLEDELGLGLPADFWWFLETYGTEPVGGGLLVCSPSAIDERRDIRARQREFGDRLRLVNQRRPGEVPFPIHPDPGGLLPWGGTEAGVMGLWLTGSPDADQWPVIIRDAARSEWYTHQGPLIRFLGDLLDGSLDISFLPL